ncbi:TPA: hypothetical protein HA278_02980 [Candidatus Woesearchaeota archaeon]|nr:hypothetical protein [Candidatus Woesearchaeota archaeon]
MYEREILNAIRKRQAQQHGKVYVREEDKAIAEDFYAAAMHEMRHGSRTRAKEIGRIAVAAYELYNPQTLDDAAPTRQIVKGINLPDIMHQDVVRQRLGL